MHAHTSLVMFLHGATSCAHRASVPAIRTREFDGQTLVRLVHRHVCDRNVLEFARVTIDEARPTLGCMVVIGVKGDNDVTRRTEVWSIRTLIVAVIEPAAKGNGSWTPRIDASTAATTPTTTPTAAITAATQATALIACRLTMQTPELQFSRHLA